ncbi:glycosyltransferase family 4 protein [bacterium]|nr:glycosyltransferase family 4 protein [bacterium]
MINKIIYINSVDSEEVSGQGSFERNFISFIASLPSDVDVKVFTINPKKNLIKKKYISLKLNKKSVISYLVYQINIFYYLFKEINNNYSIYMRLAPYNLSPFIIAKIFNLNVTIRSGPVYQNLSSYNKVNNLFLLQIFKLILNYFYKNAQNIIVVTDKIKEILISDFNLKPSKIHVISNPINNSIFDGQVSKANLKKKLNINNEVKIIGFVGDIYKDQGVQHIFQALKIIKLKHQICKIKIVVVGSGSYLNKCKMIVDELELTKHVIFTGRVKPTEVFQYISIFDICLAPFTKSDYIIKGSSALKILEYLYCNKPVITIDVKEYRFIKDKSFGYLYEIDNLNDLAEKILLALNDENIIDSKTYVKKYYSKKKTFSKYLNIITNNHEVN